MRNAFPILFAAGALAGLVWLLLGDPARRLTGRWRDAEPASFLRLDAGLAALATGLLGGRAAYVGAHWDYFASHLKEALSFSAGGLSWVGGALAAMAGLAVYAALRRAPFWPLADAVALPAALLAAVSWSGCLIDGCAYGRPLPSESPLELFASDFFNSRLPRWPTQVVGLLSCFALVLALLAIEPRNLRPGLLACLTAVTLGLIGSALSFARGDPVPLLAGIRLDFLGAAGVAALGAASLITLRRRTPA
jgi:phosphatidylglycerol:prolipoprotein diacylglycerol transferase